jgi:hypothetical protein
MSVFFGRSVSPCDLGHIFWPFLLFIEKCVGGNMLCAYGADLAHGVVRAV